MIDYIPRAIDVRIAEVIAVVPRPHVLQGILHAIVGQQLLYIRFRKAEIFVIARIRDGIHLEVVDPREDALLRDAQAACHHREEQIRVGFERFAEEAPQEGYHLVVVPIDVSLVQRNVVFIDQQNHLLAVVRVEHPH